MTPKDRALFHKREGAPKMSLWKKLKRKLFGAKRFHKSPAPVDIMHTSDAFLERFVLPYIYNDDMKHPTPMEFRRLCLVAMKKGYVVLPPCDNVGSDGNCRGHK